MTTFSELQRLAQASGLVLRSYSGRGMYGRCCPSISGDTLGSIFRDLMNGGLSLGINIGDLLGTHRSDSLGLGIIVYWPDIAWEDDSFG